MSEDLEIIEKRQVKRQVNGLAGILIGYSSMVYVITFGYMILKTIEILFRSFNNEQKMEELFNELMVQLLGNGILPILGVMLGMVFILLYRKKEFFTYDLVYVNHKMKIKPFLLLFICFLAPQFIFTIASGVVETILNQFGYSILENLNMVTEGSQTLSMFLYVVLIGPITEEFVFRGAVLRSLEKYGKIFAIIISSILFGAVHAHILQGFYAVLVGLVLGYVAVEYSIKWSILMHIANNLISEIFVYTTANLSITMGNYLNLGIFGIIFVVSCIILYYKRKQIRAYLENNRTNKKMYLYVFTSLFMVIFLVGNIILALSGIEKLSTTPNTMNMVSTQQPTIIEKR